ncbi:MAG: cytochrome c biogenesis CcdA family protein [Candidatus Promineifilaceae bacterium]
MLETARRPLRALSPLQLILLGVAAVVALFLILGTLLDARPAAEAAFNPLGNVPFLGLAVLAFGGGLLSFASPCTLPILPAYFAFAFSSGRRQIALNTLLFMLGLATTFSLMGATASAIGRLLRQNQLLIMILGGGLIIAFGLLSLMGKGFGGLQRDEETAAARTPAGSYLFGLTFAVGWTSCVGPILGTVLTMAGAGGSVGQGMMLLFIYTLGLGLPLILVSTFFGRASRQSLFWRLLRGKGWSVRLPVALVGLVWALALWRIFAALAEYALPRLSAAAELRVELSAGQELGLLAAALLLVGLWIVSGGRSLLGKLSLRLHTTQLVSGLLLIVLGYYMLSGRLAAFASLISPDLALWFADVEEALVGLFSRP